jgi:hypothetical protein
MNERIEEEQLINEATLRMSQLAKGRHLLCVQDTCEVNLSGHKGRLKPNSGLGRSDKSDTVHCFKLHPGLVLDAYNLSPLGFSHIKVFHRPEEMPDRIEREYKKQPIEDKESYKWIEVAEKSKDILKDADAVTFIEDREGDIYEQFVLIHLMNKKLQGRTIILQNHHDPKRTKWAAWVIGRIGGWKGYDSQGPPGVIVLKRGLDRLSYLIEGTNLVKDVSTR